MSNAKAERIEEFKTLIEEEGIKADVVFEYVFSNLRAMDDFLDYEGRSKAIGEILEMQERFIQLGCLSNELRKTEACLFKKKDIELVTMRTTLAQGELWLKDSYLNTSKTWKNVKEYDFFGGRLVRTRPLSSAEKEREKEQAFLEEKERKFIEDHLNLKRENQLKKIVSDFEKDQNEFRQNYEANSDDDEPMESIISNMASSAAEYEELERLSGGDREKFRELEEKLKERIIQNSSQSQSLYKGLKSTNIKEMLMIEAEKMENSAEAKDFFFEKKIREFGHEEKDFIKRIFFNFEFDEDIRKFNNISEEDYLNHLGYMNEDWESDACEEYYYASD